MVGCNVVWCGVVRCGAVWCGKMVMVWWVWCGCGAVVVWGGRAALVWWHVLPTFLPILGWGVISLTSVSPLACSSSGPMEMVVTTAAAGPSVRPLRGSKLDSGVGEHAGKRCECAYNGTPTGDVRERNRQFF